MAAIVSATRRREDWGGPLHSATRTGDNLVVIREGTGGYLMVCVTETDKYRNKHTASLSLKHK